MTMSKKRQIALCVDNTGYEASLIIKKVYEILPDEIAKKDDMLRIIDESGKDHLFHNKHFVLVEFPAEVERALAAA